MKTESPLRVQVPAGEDQPSWVRVGVIAAIGFGIGVGWPRLVGAKLGPSVPSETVSASPAPSARAAEPLASAAASSGPASSASPPASATPAGPMPALSVNHGVLLSCKSEEGETLKGIGACGGLAGFDAIAQPRLRKLSACPAATAATSGKLSVLFNLDFTSHKVAADVGKSSTVVDAQTFATCVKGAFQGVSLGALDHQNPRYTIGYTVVFTPTASPSVGLGDGVPAAAVVPSSAPASSATPHDDASVEVAWEVAIVRDAPRTGAVLARLPRGTRVRLGAAQEGWYKVEYTPGSEGWVYRSAIGR